MASVLAPMALAPTPAVHAASADRNGSCSPDCGGSLAPEVTARLDKAIEAVRRQAGIPGVVVGIWMPGKGNYVRATGVADTTTREPMSADSYIRIGSETKTFTVTALLELVDEHRIKLDDP
ncbi:beta-lactamase family protein, partial [Streptomyces sp. SID8455]|nr:beta-lactamase family protein [Streptomyces sp. SID8455]